jgi:TolA-binding protein
MGNGDGLVRQMSELMAEHPQSTYVAEAHYEAGRALIELNRLSEARRELEAILRDFPHSPRTKYVLVDLCLVGMKEGKDDDVMRVWDRIRTEYGKDPIAADAFQVVEPLLIERGLMDQIPPGVGLQPDEIEQRLYEAAEGLALKKEHGKAITRLSEYIRQYPEGRFRVEAHYFLGISQQAMQDEAEEAWL